MWPANGNCHNASCASSISLPTGGKTYIVGSTTPWSDKFGSLRDARRPGRSYTVWSSFRGFPSCFRQRRANRGRFGELVNCEQPGIGATIVVSMICGKQINLDWLRGMGIIRSTVKLGKEARTSRPGLHGPERKLIGHRHQAAGFATESGSAEPRPLGAGRRSELARIVKVA